MLCFQLSMHSSDSKSVGHFHLLKYFIHRLLELEESLPRGHLHSSASRQEAIKVSWEENGFFHLSNLLSLGTYGVSCFTFNI